MGTTPTGFVCYGVTLTDDEGDFLGTLTDDSLDDAWDHFQKVGLESHIQGYDGCLGHILCIATSHTEVEWAGYADISYINKFTATPKSLAALQAFCTKYEIPCDPTWVVSVCYF